MCVQVYHLTNVSMQLFINSPSNDTTFQNFQVSQKVCLINKKNMGPFPCTVMSKLKSITLHKWHASNKEG